MYKQSLCVAVLMLVGCAPMTIVNIPPQQGDTAMHSPNSRGVRTIMRHALQAVLADRPIEKAFQVLLPANTDATVYADMLPQLGKNAMWSSDGKTKGLPIVAVTQVRIRGLNAQVDVVRPQYPEQKQPSEQTVTVTLKFSPFDGWYVIDLKEWRGDVNKTALPSL